MRHSEKKEWRLCSSSRASECVAGCMDAARPTAEGGNSGSVRGISSIIDYDTVVVESTFSSSGVSTFENVCKVNKEEIVKCLLKV